MSSPNQEKQITIKELIGVNGWLLWFCVTFTILSPLNLLRYIVNLAKSETGISLIVSSAVSIAIVAYGIVVGIRLWLIRPNSLKQAKIFLIVSLCINLLIIAFSILMGESLSSKIRPTITSVILIIWWSYLRLSVRVRNTYSINRKAEETKNRTENKKNQ